MLVPEEDHVPEFLMDIPFGTARVAKRPQGSGELEFVEDYSSPHEALEAIPDLNAQYADGTIHLLFGTFSAEE